MELSREELLLTAFELPSHNGTKEDYFKALDLIKKHNDKVKELMEVVSSICKQSNTKVTTEIMSFKRKEDAICIEKFKKYASCIDREEHMLLMDHWILEYLSKSKGQDIVRLDDSSLSIFKKLYLKDRAFQQKEDLYLNKR